VVPPYRPVLQDMSRLLRSIHGSLAAAAIAFLHRPIAEVNETLEQPCRGRLLSPGRNMPGQIEAPLRCPGIGIGTVSAAICCPSSLSGPSHRRAELAMTRKAQPPHHVHVDPCRFHPSELVEKWWNPSSTYCSDSPSIRPFSIHENVRFATTPLMMHLPIYARIAAVSFMDREGERELRFMRGRSVFSGNRSHASTGPPAAGLHALISRCVVLTSHT
jgi:hypothetical protein